MGTRTVRLDDEAEKVLERLRSITGLSIMKYRLLVLFRPLVVGIAAISGCAGNPPAAPPVETAARSAVQQQADGPELGEHWVVDLQRPTAIADILPALAGNRVVVVGETHTSYGHHLVQLEVIRGLYRLHPDLAVGMEFFQQPFQPYLDAFVQGQLSEEELLRKTEYFQRWSYDYRLYRPILQFARRHKIPLVALNVPKELTAKVGKVGLDGLEARDRARLPQHIEAAGDAYKDRLRITYGMHPQRAQRNFDHFMDVQTVWDEGMAARAADYLAAHPGRNMVILAGSGHVAYGDTIPARLGRRLAQQLSAQGESGVAVVVPGAPSEAFGPELADYVVLARDTQLPPPGLLGVMLDTGSAGEGIGVDGFSPDSPAQRAGVRKGDRIVAVDGVPVRDFTALKTALLDRRPGQRVKVGVVRRDNDGQPQRLEYTVTLQAKPRGRGHHHPARPSSRPP